MTGLVAAVVDGAVGGALLGGDGVRKRVAGKSPSQYGGTSLDRSIIGLNTDWLDLPFRVEDYLATLVGGGLVGTAVEEAVAIAISRTEVEAAELLLLLGVLVVVGQVVRLSIADVDACRAGAAAGHENGATALVVLLVLLRDLHLVLAGSQL